MSCSMFSCKSFMQDWSISKYLVHENGRKKFTIKAECKERKLQKVPLTVAKKHQHLFCAELHSGIYFDAQPEFGPGN